MHPFDDPDIVAGQGSLGLELLEDVPDLARVVVPVGGGGLARGMAIAVKAARPEVEVVGVQAAACAPYPESLRRGEPVPASSALTIADGIAVKRPGELTLGLLDALRRRRSWSSRRTTSPRRWCVLMERCKLVVEGAGRGRRGGAARAARCTAAAQGTTVVVLSGGNVDPGLLPRSRAATRAEAGRRLVLLTRVPDRPGDLAQLLAARRRRPAPTSSTSRTCARGSTCTCARPRSSSCSRRAATTTPRRSLARWTSAGYETRVMH